MPEGNLRLSTISGQARCRFLVEKKPVDADLPQVKITNDERMFCDSKRGISQALPRSLKKMIGLYKTVYTKVSWLMGNFSVGLPTRPLIQGGRAVTVIELKF